MGDRITQKEALLDVSFDATQEEGRKISCRAATTLRLLSSSFSPRCSLYQETIQVRIVDEDFRPDEVQQGEQLLQEHAVTAAVDNGQTNAEKESYA